jgi:hypothetical protein
VLPPDAALQTRVVRKAMGIAAVDSPVHRPDVATWQRRPALVGVVFTIEGGRRAETMSQVKAGNTRRLR